MMVNFRSQLDQASEYLGIWSNLILGVSVRVRMRLTLESIGYVKEVTLPPEGEPNTFY